MDNMRNQFESIPSRKQLEYEMKEVIANKDYRARNRIYDAVHEAAGKGHYEVSIEFDTENNKEISTAGVSKIENLLKDMGYEVFHWRRFNPDKSILDVKWGEH